MVMCMTKKMSKVLMDANQELQITGVYIRDWDSDKMKATGYCAIGFLACQTKNVDLNGGIGNEYSWFREAFGINAGEVLNHDRICPACVDDWSTVGYCGYNKHEPRTATLIALIIHMNDEHEMTFKEIGKYLKKMGY